MLSSLTESSDVFAVGLEIVDPPPLIAIACSKNDDLYTRIPADLATAGLPRTVIQCTLVPFAKAFKLFVTDSRCAPRLARLPMVQCRPSQHQARPLLRLPPGHTPLTVLKSKFFARL